MLTPEQAAQVAAYRTGARRHIDLYGAATHDIVNEAVWVGLEAAYAAGPCRCRQCCTDQATPARPRWFGLSPLTLLLWILVAVLYATHT